MWKMWGAGARMWKCRGKTSAQAKSKSNGRKPRGQTFVKVGNPGCHFLAVNAGRARHSRNRIGPALRLLGEGGAAGCGCHGSRAKLQNNREILSPKTPTARFPWPPMHVVGLSRDTRAEREGTFLGARSPQWAAGLHFGWYKWDNFWGQGHPNRGEARTRGKVGASSGGSPAGPSFHDTHGTKGLEWSRARERRKRGRDCF